MNNKFSIGVVVAIVLQVSAFVWWTAQQAQTIMQLETEMAELTAKTEQEKQFNLQRDVSELKLQLIELENKTGEVFEMLSGSIDDRFSNMGKYVDDSNNSQNDVDSKNHEHYLSLFGVVETEFAKHEAWIDDIEYAIDQLLDEAERLQAELDRKIAELEKKLSDRISDR